VYDIWSRDFDWARMGAIPVGIMAMRRFKPEVRLKRWQFRSYLESRYFPLYSNNLSLQARLRTGDPRIRNTPGPRPVDLLGFLADTVAFPDSVELDLRAHLRFLEKERFELSGDNRRSLARISALAKEHDFEVYLAPAPAYQALAEAPAFRRYYGQVQKALASVNGEGSRIHLVFDQPMTFPASEMQNADHLVLKAADRYTMELARRIREIETGSR
jgi:hypothetical protein